MTLKSVKNRLKQTMLHVGIIVPLDPISMLNKAIVSDY